MGRLEHRLLCVSARYTETACSQAIGNAELATATALALPKGGVTYSRLPSCAANSDAAHEERRTKPLAACLVRRAACRRSTITSKHLTQARCSLVFITTMAQDNDNPLLARPVWHPADGWPSPNVGPQRNGVQTHDQPPPPEPPSPRKSWNPLSIM